MKKNGLYVAIEVDSLVSIYPDMKKKDSPDGMELFYVRRKGYTLYILHGGMGETFAAAGTQYLITKCRFSMIINFGVVGGLTDEMKKQKICVIGNLIHYKYDAIEFMKVEKGQVPPLPSRDLRHDRNLIDRALEL